MLILRDSVASRGVIPPTVAAAVAVAMMDERSDGYDVWYLSLVGYTMNMQILGNSITSHGVFSPAVWLRLSWMVVSSELANSPCSRLQKQKSSAPLRDHRCGQVTWQVLPLLWSSHLAGTGHMGSGSGEGVPLDLLPALYLSVDAPLLVQSGSATLPNLSRPQSWSSHLAGAHERHAFGPQLWTSCPAGTRKAEGSAVLPSGTDPRTGQRAPTQEPAISKAKSVSARVFCLLPVLACLCLVSPGSGSRVPRPCPFGFLFVLVPPHVSFYWRGRRVPAPGGRDVGSSAVATTQEPAQGADPKTGSFRYPSAYGFVVYLVAPGLFFPLHFAILLWRSWHCFPCMLELFGRLDLGSACFSTTRSSNGSFTQAASSYHPVVFLPLPVVPNHTDSVPVFTRIPEDSFLAQ